jgi:DmsE family decaheme c-type cytochrome
MKGIGLARLLLVVGTVRTLNKNVAALIACLLLAGMFAVMATAKGAGKESSTAKTADASAETPQYSSKGADTCIVCHDDFEVLSLFKTRHGQRADARSPFGKGNLQCEACHGPGGDHARRIRSGQERPPIPHFGFNSTSSASERNDMCLGCHQHDMKHGWTGGSHQREGISCADCHQMHVARDPMLSESAHPQVCFGCHQRQKVQTYLPFAHPVRQGQMGCIECHDPHGTTADFALVKRSLNDTCFSCHADKRGPFLWEHAPAIEDCSLCHQAHGSSHPGLLTKRAPLLCQQCHSQAGHPSLPLTAAALPGGNPTALFLGQGCINCHSQIHGSNHPSGAKLMR